MRCKSCNVILSKMEIRVRKTDGSPEDMCTRCRKLSAELYTYTEDHKHLFEKEYYTPVTHQVLDIDQFL